MCPGSATTVMVICSFFSINTRYKKSCIAYPNRNAQIIMPSLCLLIWIQKRK